MPHRSFVNNDMIELVFDGDVTLDTLKQIMIDSHQQAQELERKGIPVRVLVDFRKIGEIQVPADKLAQQGMRSLEFYRMAGYGANPEMQGMTNAIAAASGKGGQAQHFATREQAMAWLMESQS